MILFLLLVFVLTFVQVYRYSYNLFDPIVFGSIGIPMSAILIYVLAEGNYLSFHVPSLFMLVLVSYVLGSLTVSYQYSSGVFRKKIYQAVNDVPFFVFSMTIIITLILTFTLLFISFIYGGEGENRFLLQKLIKPVFVLHSGLFFVSLVMLLRESISMKFRVLLVLLLIVPSIFFSGKSFVLYFVFFMGMIFFIYGYKLNLLKVVKYFVLVMMGYFSIAFISFGVNSFDDALAMLVHRFYMYGDVYIYAYQFDLLDQLRGYYESFLSYTFHPFIAVFGLRAYDLPLGSMLSTTYLGHEEIRGPNPQAPVLLDLFFKDNYTLISLVAFLYGFFGFVSRYLVCTGLIKSNYLAITVISLAIFTPWMAFFDFSLLLTSYVSAIGTLAVLWSIHIIFKLLPRHKQRHEIFNHYSNF